VSKNGCWEWTWNKDKDGYGLFHARPITQRAHRFSFYYHNGYLPDDMCVCHSCDNPSCVNPNHLWIGTVKDNNRDAMNKGRKIPPNRGKTICKRGHLYTEENTVNRKNNARACRICLKLIHKKAKLKYLAKLKKINLKA